MPEKWMFYSRSVLALGLDSVREIDSALRRLKVD
jgi:hypothetical protein